MAFTFKDNSDLFKDHAEDQIRTALEAVGQAAETYAKKGCPVDTGNLRNSISHDVAQSGSSELAAYIGTNVEYAPYVEMGTSRAKAQPFIRPAVLDHINSYKNIVKAHLQK